MVQGKSNSSRGWLRDEDEMIAAVLKNYFEARKKRKKKRSKKGKTDSVEWIVEESGVGEVL